MLTGTLVTVAGFVPVGFAQSGAGEYCFSLFAVVGIALLVSWIVAVLFTPLTGVCILPDTLKQHGGHGEPGRFCALVPRHASTSRMRKYAGDRSRDRGAVRCSRCSACASCSSSSSRPPTGPSCWSI